MIKRRQDTMKKLAILFSVLVLALSMCIGINAEGTASLSGDTSVTVGGNIEFTASISGCPDVTSLGVEVSYGAGFELVSGTWLKDGSMKGFFSATNQGALAVENPTDLNGAIFKLTLKATAANASAQNVSVVVIARNGNNDLLNSTVSKSVSILCAEHSYGDYVKIDDTNHSRTCTVCGNVESKAHSWSKGTVTKEATCKENGTKEFDCSICKGKKTETIEKSTKHTYGAWTKSKDPTCTEKGEEKRTCSVCAKEEKRDIEAKGHDVKTFKVTKEATCKAEGTKEGDCTVCKKKVTEKVEKLEHKFGEPVVKKEATATAEGLQVYTCTECKETKEEKIPKLGDQTTAPETTTAAPETTAPVTTSPVTTPSTSSPESTAQADVTTRSPETTQKAPDKLVIEPQEDTGNSAPVIAVVVAVIVVGCVAAAAIIILRKYGMI